MYDGGKIITGLIIFVALVSFPILYTGAMGKAGDKPEPKAPENETKCVESKEFMQAWHMDMLNEWRDEVVREGNRIYTAQDGEKHEMSLTNNCLKCHNDREKFCDECHNYVGVSPYCWDCHIESKGE